MLRVNASTVAFFRNAYTSFRILESHTVGLVTTDLPFQGEADLARDEERGGEMGHHALNRGGPWIHSCPNHAAWSRLLDTFSRG